MPANQSTTRPRAGALPPRTAKREVAQDHSDHEEPTGYQPPIRRAPMLRGHESVRRSRPCAVNFSNRSDLVFLGSIDLTCKIVDCSPSFRPRVHGP